MLRIRETDGPSRAPAAHAVAPLVPMGAATAVHPSRWIVRGSHCGPGIDISRIMVIGRHDAMASYADRKPNLRIICGSI